MSEKFIKSERTYSETQSWESCSRATSSCSLRHSTTPTAWRSTTPQTLLELRRVLLDFDPCGAASLSCLLYGVEAGLSNWQIWYAHKRVQSWQTSSDTRPHNVYGSKNPLELDHCVRVEPWTYSNINLYGFCYNLN